MKYLSQEKLCNKKVILRCDFNVPVKDGKITDNSKIIKSLKTINYLLDNNNMVIILSHFGRVKNESDKENNSLYIVYEELKKYVNVDFIKNNEQIENILKNSNKQCFLLENTRFTDLPIKRESANDIELAKYWASFADIFVLDAFASMHRAHSSTAGIGNFLPTYIGFLAESEFKNLDLLVNNPNRPFVVIMGGAKVDDKIDIIINMIKKCDKLILTGGILNTFLKVMGFNVGKSLVSCDEKVLNNVKLIIDNYIDKIFYSNKFIVLSGENILEKSIEEIIDDDIIFDNIVNIYEHLSKAKLAFFNGTCGKFEEKEYSKGTENLLKELRECSAKVIIGGGDTVSAVIKYHFENDFYYLSSGVGATLEYVSTGHLKAIDYLENNGI